MTATDDNETTVGQLFGSILSRYGIPSQGLPLRAEAVPGSQRFCVYHADGDGDRGDLESDLIEAARKLAPMQQQMPVAGKITRWHIGDVNPWGKIEVEFGPFTADVHVTSGTARHLAIDVLADQGPYLAYQPPNPQMREFPRENLMFAYSTRDRAEWQRRADVRDVAESLRRLRDRVGADVFGWALQLANEQ